MKVLITGKGGMIAQRLSGRLSGKFDVVATTSDSAGPHVLDLASPGRFDYGIVEAGDLVVHLASVSSPDRCEREYAAAYKINVEGTAYFIRECLKRGARVLFMSSDAVYGESKEGEPAFDENSKTNPAGKYGEMKLLVEKEFAGNANFKAFRLSYVLSKDDKFLKYLSECSAKQEAAEVYCSFSRNAVCIQDVLAAVENVAGRWAKTNSPAINICGDELVSRKDVAQAYAEIVDGSLRIKTVPAPPGFFLARPKVINVASLYLSGLLGRKPMTVRAALLAEFGKQEAV